MVWYKNLCDIGLTEVENLKSKQSVSVRLYALPFHTKSKKVLTALNEHMLLSNVAKHIFFNEQRSKSALL